MLTLLRSHIRRGSRNSLIISLVFFSLAAWIALSWTVMGLNHHSVWEGEALWVPLIAGLVALVGAPFVFRSWRTFRNPCVHPAVRAFGRFADLNAFLAAVHPEEAAATPEQAGKIFFGPALLVVPTLTGVEIIAKKEIGWIYKQETRLKAYAVVTVAKAHTLCIHTFEGKNCVLPLEVADTETRIDPLMASVVASAPWAKVGYDGAFRARWMNSKARVSLLDPIRKKRDEIFASRP